jgi:hypothetical protein
VSNAARLFGLLIEANLFRYLIVSGQQALRALRRFLICHGVLLKF